MAWRTTQHRERATLRHKEPSLSLNSGTCVLCGFVPLWRRPRVAILSAKNLARNHLEHEGAHHARQHCQEGGSKPMTQDNSSRAEWAATREGSPAPTVRHSKNASATLLCLVEHAE